jgi:Reverse transcriptase (RNA-dependent DNA polymerase)
LPSNIHQEVVKTIGYLPPLHPAPQRLLLRRVNTIAFDILSKQHGVQIFSASIGEIDALLAAFGKEVLVCECGLTINKESTLAPGAITPNKPLDNNKKDHKERCQTAASLLLAGISTEDIRKALAPKVYVDPKTKIPEHMHDLLPAWDAREADKLPPYKACDHKIELLPGKLLPARPLYNMLEDELLVLRKFLDENLAKGFIRTSVSPAASLVLFAKKPGGGLCFCVDYRALNTITIKNRYPLPLIQETLARLSRAKIYTKLDVIATFNRIRITEEQEYLMAFNTRYGLYETLVILFGLSNAPATFQARINKVLHPYLDVFCTAYIDDILVYSDDLTSHRQHVRLVVEALRDAGLQLDVKKCEFEVTEVTYLGMIVSTDSMRIDPAKVTAITNWEPPSNMKDIQAFLGFANFYRRFINSFSRIVRLLVTLTRKGVRFF